MASPKYKILYGIDGSNLTTDTSLFPFSLRKQQSGVAVGNVMSDIPVAGGDRKNCVTIERTDKNIVYLRSQYKLFDLLAYMGGLIYGLLVLFYFIKRISKL